MSYKVITPLGLRLLVEPLPKKEETLASGIVLAETVNADLTEAIVVRVSSGIAAFYEKERLPESEIPKVGDKIVFSTGTGLGQHEKGKYLLWLQLGEIWGFVTKEA